MSSSLISPELRAVLDKRKAALRAKWDAAKPAKTSAPRLPEPEWVEIRHGNGWAEAEFRHSGETKRLAAGSLGQLMQAFSDSYPDVIGSLPTRILPEWHCILHGDPAIKNPAPGIMNHR